jgi:hypothetical protein
MCKGMCQINLAQDKNQWQESVKRVITFWVP